MTSDPKVAITKLLRYCRDNDWAGYDPYDATNSKAFEILPFLDCKLSRLVLTQTLKRSPVNIRPLLLVPKTQNAKGIALFLSGLVNLSRVDTTDREGLIEQMIDRLITLRSPDIPYWCWGYSFPWQTRTIVVPRGAPNVICTTFVATALLDAYEQRQEHRYLQMASSAANYVLNELYWEGSGITAGFSYPQPGILTQTHNVNFLAAAFLCRMYRFTGDDKFLAPALRAARYSLSKQREDGSWDYGEAPNDRWVDNFHTGYNLCALQSIGKYLETSEFESPLQRGFEFYRDNFFLKDGSTKYFHNRLYPIDVHCVAQGIITLLSLKHRDGTNVPLANSVFRWAMENLWDERGFFYYRKLRMCTIRTPYMRWSEAWMFQALTFLLNESGVTSDKTRINSAALAQTC